MKVYKDGIHYDVQLEGIKEIGHKLCWDQIVTNNHKTHGTKFWVCQ